jgi:hypothetical protein
MVDPRATRHALSVGLPLGAPLKGERGGGRRLPHLALAPFQSARASPFTLFRLRRFPPTLFRSHVEWVKEARRAEMEVTLGRGSVRCTESRAVLTRPAPDHGNPPIDPTVQLLPSMSSANTDKGPQ